MIKGTISQNGMTVDLECSNADEFVSVVHGTFIARAVVKKTSVSSSFTETPRRKKYQHAKWTNSDIANMARFIINNKDSLGGVGIRTYKLLRTSGDVRNRNMGTVWSKVAELKDYLLLGGTSKIPTSTIHQLSSESIYPLVSSHGTTSPSSRKLTVAHEA